jgi:hypothetical protein
MTTADKPRRARRVMSFSVLTLLVVASEVYAPSTIVGYA